MYRFGLRETSFCLPMDQHLQPDRTTPLQSVHSMALSTMTVECGRFVLFVLYSTTCLAFLITFPLSRTTCIYINLLVSFLSLLLAWKNGWQIISPKKSFAVFAATPTEKAEWMADINKCIAELPMKSELILLAPSKITTIHHSFLL